MWDWSLGQAGFGEQIQVYGETFWQQVVTMVVWASAVIVFVLLFVALMVTLARMTEVSQEMRRLRRVEKFRSQTPARSDGTGGHRAKRSRRRAA